MRSPGNRARWKRRLPETSAAIPPFDEPMTPIRSGSMSGSRASASAAAKTSFTRDASVTLSWRPTVVITPRGRKALI